MSNSRLTASTHHPLYKRFLNPKESKECCACQAPLTSGVAVFLAVDEKPEPFGPKCARKYAKEGALRHVPDATKGIEFLEDPCRDLSENLPEESFRSGAGETTTSRVRNPEAERYKRAVTYLLLRGRELPSLGIKKLDWSVLVSILENYEKGGVELNGPSLKTIISTMETTANNEKFHHLSFENLQACYVYGCVLRRIQQNHFLLAKEDRLKFPRLKKALEKKLYLTERQQNEVMDLAKKCLSKPPLSIKVKFVAVQPPYPKGRAKKNPPLPPSP